MRAADMQANVTATSALTVVGANEAHLIPSQPHILIQERFVVALVLLLLGHARLQLCNLSVLNPAPL